MGRMRRVMTGVLVATAVLCSGCVVAEEPVPMPDPYADFTPPLPTSSSSPILMSSYYPDLYEFDVPDGWRLDWKRDPMVPNFHTMRPYGTEYRGGIYLNHQSGWSKTGEHSSTTPEDEALKRLSGLVRKKIAEAVMLPEREIGGERAVGFAVLDVTGELPVLLEQWFVVRHDGVWVFGLDSGGGRDVVGQDLYGILDSFRWTGPWAVYTETPAPSASES